MGAVYLDQIFYHYKVSRLSNMLQGSIEDTVAECIRRPDSFAGDNPRYR